MSAEKSYATVTGLARGFFPNFFLCFFFAGPVVLDDPVAARFWGGPLGPTARGGTSCI